MRLRIAWMLGLALWAGGCSQDRSERVYDPQAIAAETYTLRSPALVMPGQLATDPDPQADESALMPWWYNRNDSRLGVRTGPRPLQVTDYVTYTDDQQQSYSTFQHDVYRRSSRTIRYGQIVH